MTKWKETFGIRLNSLEFRENPKGGRGKRGVRNRGRERIADMLDC